MRDVLLLIANRLVVGITYNIVGFTVILMETFVSNDARLPRGREDRSQEPACRQTGRKKRLPIYTFIKVSKSCLAFYTFFLRPSVFGLLTLFIIFP